MDIAEKIYKQVRLLPEPLAREVLDFVGYIELKHKRGDIGMETLKESQISVMNKIWGNSEDEVWNEF